MYSQFVYAHVFVDRLLSIYGNDGDHYEEREGVGDVISPAGFPQE